jgi:WD40 repeat protein
LITELRPKMGPNYEIYNGLFSPDGKILATTESFLGMRFWDAVSGQPLAGFETNFYSRVFAFSPDSRRVLLDDKGGLAILDLATGQTRFHWKGPVGPRAIAGAFSPDGTKVALLWRWTYHKAQSLEWDNTRWEAILWDASTGGELCQLSGRNSYAHSVLISPDGQRLVTWSEKEIRVWAIATGELVARLEGHKGDITQVSFSPDGRWLGTAYRDYTARLWPVGLLPAPVKVAAE